MKKHLGIVAAILCVTLSCKKDKGDDTCPITPESIAGTYQLISLKAGGVDIRSVYFEPCELDNTIELNANGTYQFVDAGVACDPPGTSSGNWSLSGSQFSIDLIPLTLTLDEFNCKELRGSTSYSGTTVEAVLKKVQ